MGKADIILTIVQTIVFIWDFLTWPIYQAIFKPWPMSSNGVFLNMEIKRSLGQEKSLPNWTKCNPMVKCLKNTNLEITDGSRMKVWTWHPTNLAVDYVL